MESTRSRAGQFRGLGVCVVALIALFALAAAPASAKAASPVLEFVSSSPFPIEFNADGGEVTAAMDGFDTVVHCSDSEGEGEVIGPRATLSEYVFTGCEGIEGGSHHECHSEGADPETIETEAIESDLVYLDQAKHEVAMLLNPGGGIYMDFECGSELVEARGPFLAPVDPINKVASSFTATLTSSGATQVPSEYENVLGEKRKAIPRGEREGHAPATTGVDLSFTIHTSASLEIKAVSAAEIEAQQREEEAAVAAKLQDAEAKAADAARKRREDEATAAGVARKLQIAKGQLKHTRLLSKGLKRCAKIHSHRKRTRCERRVKKKYGGPQKHGPHRGSRRHRTHHRAAPRP